MQGQLGAKLISDLIRELASKKASGLLRVTNGKVIKAIFFESGNPEYAISNLTTDQLEHKLLKEGFVTDSHIAQAKQRAGKANQLGPALVEMGVLGEEVIHQLVTDQVMGVILSLFEWSEGEYTFDERIRASHDMRLETSAADLILIGARRVANDEKIAATIAPPEGMLVRSKSGNHSDTGKLIPIESYVLSRIDSPTRVSEVGTLSGISDEDARHAVCALVAAGLLKLAEEVKEQVSESSEEEEDALNTLREDVSRKIHFFSSADFYEVLGITRQASTSDIKTAYYQLAKKYHPDRYRQPEYNELRAKLEALFARVSQAYETLKEPVQRRSYDERIRRSPEKAASGILTTPPSTPITTGSVQNRPGSQPGAANTATGPIPVTQPSEASKAEPIAHQQVHSTFSAPGHSAEHLYQQGRARFDRKEYHAAVHLLREAVKLDPSKPQYHFHLGIALIKNPRTRREADEHLTRAADLDQYNANMRVKLGQLYREAGLPKKAEHYFKSALTIDPDNRAAKRELNGGGDRKKDDEAAPIWKSDLGSLAKRLFKK